MSRKTRKGNAAVAPSVAPAETPTVLPLRVLAALIAILGLVPLANYLPESPVVPWFATGIRQWTIGTIAILASTLVLAALLRDRLDRLVTRIESALTAPGDRIFATAIAVIAFALAAVLAWYCFGGAAFFGDEFSQLFQARVLESGRLSAAVEPHMEFFNTSETLAIGGRWFSQFPVGWAALLALGDALRVVWLVNPVFAGWAARNIYRFAQRTGIGESRSRWTAIAFALSPLPLFMASSQMNHAATLAFISAGLAALPVWAGSADAKAVYRAAAVIGFAFAAAATVRPFDAALCALVVGAFQLVSARGSRMRWQSLAWQLAAGAVPLAFLLVVNAKTTGSPLLFGYDALNGPEHRPGFHMDPRGNVHSPLRGLELVSAYLMRLNLSLFESPVPALVLVVVAMALIRRPTRWDYLLGAIIVVVAAGYSAYWHEGYFMAAPRFLHAAVPAFVWFAVRAPIAVEERVTTPLVRRSVQLVLPAMIAFGWLAPVNPYRLFGVWTLASSYRHPDGLPRPDVFGDARRAGLSNALVFVRESWHGSLTARLRALGTPPLLAETILAERDACALQTAMDAIPPDASGLDAVRYVLEQASAAGEVETVPGHEGEPEFRVALAPGRALTPECERELALERTAGGAPLAWLSGQASFDASGRLTGRVVYARDLGPRDSLLRVRFADRQWYRYDVARGATSGRFTPISR